MPNGVFEAVIAAGSPWKSRMGKGFPIRHRLSGCAYYYAAPKQKAKSRKPDARPIRKLKPTRSAGIPLAEQTLSRWRSMRCSTAFPRRPLRRSLPKWASSSVRSRKPCVSIPSLYSAFVPSFRLDNFYATPALAVFFGRPVRLYSAGVRCSTEPDLFPYQRSRRDSSSARSSSRTRAPMSH